MTDLAFLHRMDKKNVGDFVCPPFMYFPFKPSINGDIIDESFDFTGIQTAILGGGGLGRKGFQHHLDRIKQKGPENIVIWGAGVDYVSNKSELLEEGKEYDLYGNFFEEFSDVGIRVFSENQKFRYVPCASCMDNLFFKYRDVKPTKRVGYYNHKRNAIIPKKFTNRGYVSDNNGNDFESKLKFLSQFECIVTNSYHGVYWASLLNRKVIVIPNKSGLLSFKHMPAVSWDGKITDDLIDSAIAHEGVLEESRKCNLDFYKDMADKYNLV